MMPISKLHKHKEHDVIPATCNSQDQEEQRTGFTGKLNSPEEHRFLELKLLNGCFKERGVKHHVYSLPYDKTERRGISVGIRLDQRCQQSGFRRTPSKKFYQKNFKDKKNRVSGNFTSDTEEMNYTAKDLVENLKNGKYKNITVLTGAGISVNAGIPDFRSPKIGLYATLKEKYGMDDPTEIFSLQRFIKDPTLFYNFFREQDWNSYSPTLTHYFIGLLDYKGLLNVNYTQNIDALELKAGISKEKVVAAHGNMSGAHCPKCGQSKNIKTFEEYVKRGKIWRCNKCKCPIKPTVVFFGESLPTEFSESMDKIKESDLGIIIGTSLAVSPFNSLPEIFPRDTSIVTINREPIKHIPALGRPKCITLEGDCDDVISNLIKDLGWEQEFKEFIAAQKEVVEHLKSLEGKI
ncbi:unnamed protein product [Moneuplotes crassus]|uniref:Deacetylase sirtuin-type domain-containing protein n=1 Tax=Euplotes crassus TaxID=5936 RepID=A0AAD1UMQ5_EUPCR|nr:unnamed protein product [Moneuplotes crassus]